MSNRSKSKREKISGSSKSTREKSKREKSIRTKRPGSVRDVSIRTAKSGDRSRKSSQSPTSLVHWTMEDRETPFTPTLHQYIARAELMKNHAVNLAERMRSAAQPNAEFRRKRLVACDVGQQTERMKSIAVFKETTKTCFGDQSPLAEYVNQLVEMEEEADRSIARHFPSTSDALRCDAIERIRGSRSRGDSSRVSTAREAKERIRRYPRSVYQTADLPWTARAVDGPSSGERAPSVDALQKLLDDMAKYQMAIAKAIATYILAEKTYLEKVHRLTNAIKPPNHQMRWTAVRK